MVNRNLLRQVDLSENEVQQQLQEAFYQEDTGKDVNDWLPWQEQEFEVNKIVTGRVLSIVGIGDNLNEARTRAYRAVEAVRYEGKIYRRDIGARAAGRGGIRPPADERSAAGPGREAGRRPIESQSQRSVGHR